MKKYIEVDGASVVGNEFALQKSITLSTGKSIQNPSLLSDAELVTQNIYPVVNDIEPTAEQFVVSKTYVVGASQVDATVTLGSKDLQAAKDTKIQTVYAKYKDQLDDLVKNYSPGEMAQWTELEAEARTYDGDGVTIGPIMQAELDHGLTTAADLAARVIAKADIFKAAKAEIVANRTKEVADINALTTIQEILDY